MSMLSFGVPFPLVLPSQSPTISQLYLGVANILETDIEFCTERFI
jgi:hypothetical protein